MLEEWAKRWMDLARYDGGYVPEVSKRIKDLLQLWQEPIPEPWRRGLDTQLHGDRYRRRDIDSPTPGEHAIEHAIHNGQLDRLTCFGNRVLDGVNALPLVRDAGGGRKANVEADILLLTEGQAGRRIFLCEVKEKSNNAWYAAVENLRQLRLYTSSPEAASVFFRRNPAHLYLADTPVTGIVLAPHSFYFAPGQKNHAVPSALELLARFNSDCKVDACLALWDPELSNIASLSW